MMKNNKNNISLITFYCNVQKNALDIVEFYKQDIKILNKVANRVVIAFKWRDIDWKSDIIFVWWWTYAFVPVLYGKLFRKKVVITGTFNYGCKINNRDYSQRNLIQRIIIKFSIKYAWKNILVSNRELELISRDWKLNNLEYSPHIVDIEKYSFSDRREQRLLFTICWMEKENIYRKCIREILESVKVLVNNGTDIKLIIAGRNGGSEKSVILMIENFGIASSVEFIGEISEKKKIQLLQDCTIYLQPSRYEGFGLAIAEAMSCGAPVISTDVGEVRNVVGDAGVILKNCNPIPISNSIKKLLGDKNKLNQIGKNARERIVTYFSYHRRLEDFNNILKG